MQNNDKQKRVLLGAIGGTVGVSALVLTLIASYSFNVAKSSEKLPFEPIETAKVTANPMSSELERWVSTEDFANSEALSLVSHSYVYDKVKTYLPNVKPAPSRSKEGSLPHYYFSSDEYVIGFDFEGRIIYLQTTVSDEHEIIGTMWKLDGRATPKSSGINLEKLPNQEPGYTTFAKTGLEIIDVPETNATVYDVEDLAKVYGILPSALKFYYQLKSDWNSTHIRFDEVVEELINTDSPHLKDFLTTGSPEDAIGYLSLMGYPLADNPSFVALAEANFDKSLDEAVFGGTKPVYDVEDLRQAIKNRELGKVKPLTHQPVGKITVVSGEVQDSLSTYFLVPLKQELEGFEKASDYKKQSWQFWKSEFEPLKLDSYLETEETPVNFYAINGGLVKSEVKTYGLTDIDYSKTTINHWVSVGNLTSDKTYLFSRTGRFIGVMAKKPVEGLFHGKEVYLEQNKYVYTFGWNTPDVKNVLWKARVSTTADLPEELNGLDIIGSFNHAPLMKTLYVSSDYDIFTSSGEQVGTLVGDKDFRNVFADYTTLELEGLPKEVVVWVKV